MTHRVGFSTLCVIKYHCMFKRFFYIMDSHVEVLGKWITENLSSLKRKMQSHLLVWMHTTITAVQGQMTVTISQGCGVCWCRRVVVQIMNDQTWPLAKRKHECNVHVCNMSQFQVRWLDFLIQAWKKTVPRWKSFL